MVSLKDRENAVPCEMGLNQTTVSQNDFTTSMLPRSRFRPGDGITWRGKPLVCPSGCSPWTIRLCCMNRGRSTRPGTASDGHTCAPTQTLI